MFWPLVLGSALLLANLSIQIIAVVILVRLLMRRLQKADGNSGLGALIGLLSMVFLVLFAGHLLQFATWAVLFVRVGEFAEFATAFYHSTVNFTSLGYGDIVMSERWRLLGALEAANGVLMFGLSAGTILSVMNLLFNRHVPAKQRQELVDR